MNNLLCMTQPIFKAATLISMEIIECYMSVVICANLFTVLVRHLLDLEVIVGDSKT